MKIKKERIAQVICENYTLNYALSLIDSYELYHNQFHVPVCRSQVDIGRLLQGLTAQNSYTLDQTVDKIHHPHQLIWANMRNAMLHLAKRVVHS